MGIAFYLFALSREFASSHSRSRSFALCVVPTEYKYYMDICSLLIAHRQFIRYSLKWITYQIIEFARLQCKFPLSDCPHFHITPNREEYESICLRSIGRQTERKNYMCNQRTNSPNRLIITGNIYTHTHYRLQWYYFIVAYDTIARAVCAPNSTLFGICFPI